MTKWKCKACDTKNTLDICKIVDVARPRMCPWGIEDNPCWQKVEEADYKGPFTGEEGSSLPLGKVTAVMSVYDQPTVDALEKRIEKLEEQHGNFAIFAKGYEKRLEGLEEWIRKFNMLIIEDGTS